MNSEPGRGRILEKKIVGAKLITAILPKGKGFELQQVLIDEKGHNSTMLHHARGVGKFSTMGRSGLGEQLEKEIIEVMVKAEDADELFEFMFFKAEMNHPHSGIIYMNDSPVSSTVELPDLPWLPRKDDARDEEETAAGTS